MSKDNTIKVAPGVAAFLAGLRGAVVDAAKLAAKAKDEMGVKFNRRGDYMPPADFYNHRSRTFLKNKRKGL